MRLRRGILMCLVGAVAPASQGAEGCQRCHSDAVESYARTAHFLTSRRAGAESIRGSFDEGRNVLRTRVENTWFRMERRPDGFYQTGFEKGRSRTERFDLVMGSGRRGQSYLYWRNTLLYQLPVSYLAAAEGWINSPGYEDGKVHFDRPIPPQCLDCHTTAQKAGGFAAGITCQKCHGEGDAHPAALSPSRRMEVCARCHSGIVAGAPAKADVHGNQVGLLRRSKCFRASREMTCSSCHDVHQEERDLAAMSRKCAGCHQAAGCGRGEGCVDCHMPLQESGVITFDSLGRRLAQRYRTHVIGIYR